MGDRELSSNKRFAQQRIHCRNSRLITVSAWGRTLEGCVCGSRNLGCIKFGGHCHRVVYDGKGIPVSSPLGMHQKGAACRLHSAQEPGRVQHGGYSGCKIETDSDISNVHLTWAGYEEYCMSWEAVKHFHEDVSEYSASQVKKLKLAKDLLEVLTTTYGVEI